MTSINFNSDLYPDDSNGCNGRNYPYNNVTGQSSNTNYRMRLVSDTKSSICKVNFTDIRSNSRHISSIGGEETTFPNDFGDFSQAYDPDITKGSNIGFVDDYKNQNKYKIHQLNTQDGTILASGYSLRWIPTDYDSDLYIEYLNNTNFALPENNGGVYFQDYSPEGSSGSVVSWGSSIESIVTLQNVIRLTTRESENSTDQAPCYVNTPLTGYGLIPDTGIGLTPINIVKYIKSEGPNNNTDDSCDDFQYSTTKQNIASGYIFMKAGSSSGDSSITLFIHIQNVGSLNYNELFYNEEYFIESIETSGSNFPCFRYTITDLIRLDVGNDEFTFKRVKFKENGFPEDGSQYELGTGSGGTTIPVFQWDIGDLVIDNNNTAEKISADLFSWIPTQSVIYVRECDPSKPLQIPYGPIIQQTGSDPPIFGHRGINTVKTKLNRLNDVRFINLEKHIFPFEVTSIQDESLVYSVNKQYVANWDINNPGETLIQTLSKQNFYDQNYNYEPGQKVIQIHKLNTSNEIEDFQYSLGTVISWEYPDPNNLSDTSPMILTIKIDKKGPKLPNSNTPVDEYQNLQSFKLGSLISTDSSLEFAGKIVPYSDFILEDFSIFEDENWPYSYDNPTKSYFISDKNINFENITSDVKYETPVPSFIGTTRIRCVSINPRINLQDSYPLYKIHIFDTELNGPSSLFGSLTNIAYKFNENVSPLPILKIAEFTGRQEYIETFDNNQILSRKTIIFEPNKDKMILELPSQVKDSPFETVLSPTNSITFEVQKIYAKRFTTGNEELNIPVEDGSSSLDSDSVFLIEEPNLNWYIINTKTGETFNLVPDLNDISDNKTISYKTPSSSGYNKSILSLKRKIAEENSDILVIAKVSVTKTISNISERNLGTNTEQLTTPFNRDTDGKYKNKLYINLMTTGQGGILNNLDSVYIISNNNIVPGTKNIKDLFEIDYGTTDQKITNPKLILKSGYTTSNGNLKSEYFGTTSNQEIDPFSVNLEISYSFYTVSQTANISTRESYKLGSNILEIKDIPFYDSPNTGKRNHYSTIIDFRPSTFNLDSDNLGNTKFMPHPDWSDSILCSSYIPRKDRVILDGNGNFEVIYGNPSINPTYPPEPNECCLSLHLLEKPPYLFDIKNVKIIDIDNKRYTMKDIGKLDKRIKKLEEYTKLSALENNAEGYNVTDSNGNIKFKTSILVDSFSGHNVGDVLNPDYNISIDQVEKCLRPPFDVTQIKLKEDSENTSSNKFIQYTKSGTNEIKTSIWTFPYETVIFIAQPLASSSIKILSQENVNWGGDLDIFPSCEIWIDQDKTPDVIKNIGGINDGWESLDKNPSPITSLGSHWGSWKAFGSTTNTKVSTENIPSDTKNTRSSISSTINSSDKVQLQESLFNDLLLEENQSSVGGNKSDISILPYIKEQKLKLIGDNLKPNTRMYVFFDNIDISENCYAYKTEKDMILDTNRFSFSSSSDSDLSTNSEGKIYISFFLPKGTFRSGERIFDIIDNKENNKNKSVSNTSCIYYANGTGITRETEIKTTKEFKIKNKIETTSLSKITDTSSNQVINSLDNNINKTCPPGYSLKSVFDSSGNINYICEPNVDFISQTFFVNSSTHPEGIMLDSIDLFFAKKPTNPNLKVSVEIRPVTSGYPSLSDVYPGSKVSLKSTEINISNDPIASQNKTKTKFKFDYPIMLLPGEHSIVIKAQSTDFEIYVGELGKNIINTDVQINSQPYTGVLYTATNSNEWNAELNMDLMMVLNKCKFQKNVEYNLPFSNITTTNKNFETFFLQSNYLDSNSCRVSWESRIFPFNGNQEVLDTTPNTDTYLSKKYIMGPNIPIKVTAKAKTTNEDISPIIDSDRIGFISAENKIESNTTENNGELNPYSNYVSSGPNRARYISRIVTLEEGFESNNCRVVASVYKPKNTNIDFFVKLQNSYDTKEFHDRNYIKLVPIQPSNFNLVESGSENDWYEVVFELPEDTVESFNKYCVKVCLYSTDTAYVPKVKNLRVMTVL